MAVKAFFQKHLWDLLVVGALTLVSSGFAIYLALPQKEGNHVAMIKRDNTLIVNPFDLAFESETVERDFTIQGLHDTMTIGVMKNKIRVVESHCPNQYCVGLGWSSDSHHPLVCAYNHITITVGEANPADIYL